jgi:hypothetical protein
MPTQELPILPKWTGKLLIPKIVTGVGNYADGEACVMSEIVAMEREANGVPLNGASDKPSCVCPVIRQLAIRVNDAIKDDAEREKWALEMIPKMIGTRGDGKTQARAYLCADRAVRKFAADAMERAGRKDSAASLRGCAVITDRAKAKKGQRVAHAAADAAAYAAAYAAYAAAAAAAAAAYAADAAAYAAAYAYAADAAADAAAYAAASLQSKMQLLNDLCAL